MTTPPLKPTPRYKRSVAYVGFISFIRYVCLFGFVAASVLIVTLGCLWLFQLNSTNLYYTSTVLVLWLVLIISLVLSFATASDYMNKRK